MTQVDDLVSGASAGDSCSWSELVDRFAGLVWSVARSVGLMEADAADVSQTTWMRLAEHLDDIRDTSRIGSWLATTARREAIRVSRLGARQVPVDPWGWLDQVDSLAAQPDEVLVAKERTISVQVAVASISEKCRQLLLALAADPPRPYSEVSSKLEMPVGSIGPTRARCLHHVARIMAEWEVEASGGEVSERTSR